MPASAAKLHLDLIDWFSFHPGLPCISLQCWLLTAIDGCWRLLAATDGYYWRLLTATTDGYWLLLTAADGYWRLLTAIDGYWWLLLMDYWRLLLTATTDGYYCQFIGKCYPVKTVLQIWNTNLCNIDNYCLCFSESIDVYDVQVAEYGCKTITNIDNNYDKNDYLNMLINSLFSNALVIMVFIYYFFTSS